jgi:hypothetical protein
MQWKIREIRQVLNYVWRLHALTKHDELLQYCHTELAGLSYVRDTSPSRRCNRWFCGALLPHRFTIFPAASSNPMTSN